MLKARQVLYEAHGDQSPTFHFSACRGEQARVFRRRVVVQQAVRSLSHFLLQARHEIDGVCGSAMLTRLSDLAPTACTLT